MAAKFVGISMEDGRFFARVDNGPKFFVGKKVHFMGMTGLANAVSSANTPIYNPAAHRATHGFWADFIFPTVKCESRGIFHCINTYDRARFTFTFLQYAAHVANGDFVKFFRRLLSLGAGAEYFPDLVIKDGAICRVTETGIVRLETPETSEPLMQYLNPSVNEVEEIEAVNAAKFIHWCDNDPQHQALQVAVGIEHLREAMKKYAQRYSLDGRSDKVCLVVSDIRHQGRGKSSQILSALNTNGNDEKAFKNLLEIGKELYAGRIATLKTETNKLVAAGILGRRKYSAQQGDFVQA
ncbi:MAG: hypothetical protein AB7U82_26940 [Blastocatellales bacterium]